jgi:hypothetical protein
LILLLDLNLTLKLNKKKGKQKEDRFLRRSEGFFEFLLKKQSSFDKKTSLVNIFLLIFLLFGSSFDLAWLTSQNLSSPNISQKFKFTFFRLKSFKTKKPDGCRAIEQLKSVNQGSKKL